MQLLEEPPPHAVFILKTDNPAALLPTVRSRCVALKARIPPQTQQKAFSEASEKFYIALEGGNRSLARFMFYLEKLDKEAMSEFLEGASELTVARLRGTVSGEAAIPHTTLSRVEQTIAKATEMLDLNVNPGHISGMICASLIVLT